MTDNRPTRGHRLVWLVLWLAASAGAAPPAAEHFTRHPDIADVAVSPSGDRLAMLMYGPSGWRWLAVMPLNPIGKALRVGGFADADVTSVRWVNDERLVFEAFQRGTEINEGGAGTFAVNPDGSDLRQLIAWRGAAPATGTSIRSKVLPYGWHLSGSLDDGSADVLVYRTRQDGGGDLSGFELARLDSSAGTLRPLGVGLPANVRGWWFDAQRELRIVMTHADGRTRIHWRRGDEWVEVAAFDELAAGGFSPWHVDADGGLLVLARAGGDTVALHRFDLARRELDAQPLIAVDGFDMNARRVIDTKTRQLLGVRFTADAALTVWLDEGLARIQQGIDAALPRGRSNQLHCGRCTSTRHIVVGSSAANQPVEYYLFDRSNASLQRIGASRPWIDPATQGTVTLQRITTRDGLQMPLYVTSPAGARDDQALPAVVLVHGGPWARGFDLRWEAEAQFLASRGYRVLQPEFRSSEGYGFKLFRAGWKQWGTTMQDDLVDAVRWAGKQGLVDEKRVCVVGGSYGGYAALMAPIVHPGVFRCAASFAGVTEIELMYSANWSDISAAAKRYSYPRLIGSPQDDAEMLARASPLKRAGELRIPVLVVQGGLDRRVPIVHARRFVDAARAAGVEVEAVYYGDEGHGFMHPSNHADYLRRLEAFLARSLRAGAP